VEHPAPRSTSTRPQRARPSLALFVLLGVLAVVAPLLFGTSRAGAQSPDRIPTAPEVSDTVVVPPDRLDDVTVGPAADPSAADAGLITIDIGGPEDSSSQSVILIVGLAVLSLAPSIILMLTSFTRIIIVFSLTRNALGLQGIPPNQVLVGLALFLSLFIMAPTLQQLNDDALQPYLAGSIDQAEAIERGREPMREFMLANTEADELEVMLEAAGDERPQTVDDVGMATLIPAFLLSELKTAFTIGFVIFIPFLIIDIVVAASLMALGMMMLPPAFISLPFKLLLFIMVGGWSLIVETLLATYT
jgi:flagellar biosynthesis protein FliP